MIAENRVEQRGLAVAVMAIDIDPAIQEKTDDFLLSVPCRVSQRHLESCRFGDVDELLHDVEAPDSRRPDQADAPGAVGKIGRRFRAAIGEAGVYCVGTFAGQIRMLDQHRGEGA